MKKLRLLNTKKCDLVDDEDYDLVKFYDWYLSHEGYVKANINGKPTKLCRFILGINDPKICVDHINRNKQDDRRCNLRQSTIAENSRNRSKCLGSTSKYLGVSWDATGGWHVSICFNKRKISIGYFADEIEAAKAYDEAAKYYHKEFASLNFPNVA